MQLTTIVNWLDRLNNNDRIQMVASENQQGMVQICYSQLKFIFYNYYHCHCSICISKFHWLHTVNDYIVSWLPCLLDNYWIKMDQQYDIYESMFTMDWTSFVPFSFFRVILTVLSALLRFTNFDYAFGIFKLILLSCCHCWIKIIYIHCLWI